MLLPWHKCQWCSYPTIHLHRNVGETQFRLGGRDQGENFEAIIEVDTYQCWKTMWKCWKTNINVLTHTSGVSQHSYTVRRLLQTWYVFYWMEHVFVDVFFIYFFSGWGWGENDLPKSVERYALVRRDYANPTSMWFLPHKFRNLSSVEQWKKPWLVRLYKGLYYPFI